MGKSIEDIASELGIVVDDCDSTKTALRQIRATAFAPGRHGLFVAGEVGTGKSTMTRVFHRCNPNHWGDEPFVARDCATIPPTLADSELFGHAKGAFTNATTRRGGLLKRVNKGTLFLDEIGHLDPEVRNKLFLVMSDGIYTPLGSDKEEEFDGKIIVAMSKTPQLLLETGALTEAFLSRIGAVVFLPPLHERSKDFAKEIIQRDIDAIREKLHIAINCTDEATAGLIETRYPDNVRGLITTFDLAVGIARSELDDDSESVGSEEEADEESETVLQIGQSSEEDASKSEGNAEESETNLQIERAHVEEALSHNALLSALGSSPEKVSDVDGIIRIDGLPDGERLAAAEKQVIEHVLKETDGNVAESSRRLGIDRRTLDNRIKLHGIVIEAR